MLNIKIINDNDYDGHDMIMITIIKTIVIVMIDDDSIEYIE